MTEKYVSLNVEADIKTSSIFIV